MNKFRLSASAKLLLSLLAQEVPASAIARQLHLSRSAVSQRIKTLIKNKYIDERIDASVKFYTLRPIAVQALLGLLQTTTANAPIPLTPQSKPALPPKRANGFRITFYPFRTEHSSIAARLKQAGFPCQIERKRNNEHIITSIGGYKLVFTTRKLTVYAPAAFYGFQIAGKVLANEEVYKATDVVKALLKAIPMRMVEAGGKLKTHLGYFEIAHTEDGKAEELTKIKSYMPLAYDLRTGKLVHWADRSLRISAEGESSEFTIEQKYADLTQDMNDNKWSHRREQDHLRRAEKAIADLASLILKDTAESQDYRREQAFKLTQLSALVGELASRPGQGRMSRNWKAG